MATAQRVNELEQRVARLLQSNATIDQDAKETLAELDNLVVLKVSECDRLADYYKQANELLDSSNFRRAKNLAEDHTDKAISFCKTQSEQLERQFNEGAADAKKNNEFLLNSEKYVKAKHAELKDKMKTIETIENNMKNVLGNIDWKNLTDLDVDRVPGLQKLFKTFFVVLYNEPEEKFTWREFKKQAFEVDKGQDFQRRMASFDVKKASPDVIRRFEDIKNDQAFQKWVVEDNKGEKLLDLCEYIDYVPPLADQVKEYHELETQVKSIEADAKRRRITFDAQKLQQTYITESQSDLHNLEAFIKDFNNRMRELDDKIGGLGQSRETIPDNLHGQARDATRPVPDSLYRP